MEKRLFEPESDAPALAQGYIDQIKDELRQLSKIQLNEGRRHVITSNDAMDVVDLFTQMEIIFLIILALILQVLVLYRPKP